MMKPTIAVAGMCSVLMCAQSIAAPAASANAKKPQTPVSETVTSHRAEINTRYAEQDKELLRADQLARGGQDEDFDAALKIYQDVHLGLELEIGSLDSWIARKRFNEVGTRLDALRLAYGNKKLQEAQLAFEEGRYGDAADLAAKVSAVCPALNEKAANLRIVARSRQKGEERLVEVSAYTILPKLKEDEINIANEIAEARVLMKNRKFEEARRRIENVYKINPFNQEAAYLATQIYAQYYTAGYHRSQADARSMMAGEAWQWVEPTFYRSAGNDGMESGQVRGSGDEKIQAQLDAIVIPSVKYDATNISSVVTHLMNTSKRFDDNGKGSGVIIDYIAPVRQSTAAVAQNTAAPQNDENLDEEGEATKPNPAAAAAAAMPNDKEIFVTLNVNNASLREILDYISFLTDLPYRVYPERVVIGALGDDVKREVFQVTPEAIAMITGDKGNAPEAEAGGDAGGEAGGDGAGGDGALVKGDVTAINISADDLKRFFGDFGIDFSNPRSNISYSNGKITCTNTQENLNQMDRFIRKLNTVSEMVQIELKTIEISEHDMEDLGFNWSLGTGSSSSGSTILGNDKWTLAQGANAVLGGTLNQMGSDIIGATGSLVSGLNIFPNIFGSHSPFGSDVQFNLSLSITALDQNERTEMISAPSVLVANKAQAVVKLTTNYFFASDWEEPEMDITSGTDAGPRVEWTPPNPDFEDETEIGTVFTVTPTIKKNGIIGLTINPKISNYIDQEHNPVDGTIYVRNDKGGWDKDPNQSRVFDVWSPIISHRELKLEVNVKDGETLVLGGLSDSNMQSRLDKIPILGDIPLIGRLFQTQSETSIRKNTLIFVTARLVNDQGLPKDMVHNGGIPDINR